MTRVCESVGPERSPFFFFFCTEAFPSYLFKYPMVKINKRGSKVSCFYWHQLYPDWQETKTHSLRKISAQSI